MNNTDLIIFSGQSNMEGEAERFPDDNSPVEGALEYRYLEDKLVPLKHPAGENISYNGKVFIPRHRDGWGTTQSCALLSAWRKRTNPVPFFCQSYIKETGRNVIAVHAAKGATTIEYWLRGGQGYEMLCKKAKRAIELTKPEHIYFVWLQGESDAIAKKQKDVYKKQMIELYESLHEDLGVEIFGNILLFIPFGYLWQQKKKGKVWKTILAGFLLSFAMEFIQPLISTWRTFDVTDIITNTAGAAIGAYFQFRYEEIIRKMIL